MKTSLITAAFVMTLTSASAFAHHPAADNVDPEIYAMIDENVADTPHADLTFDDMGSDNDSMGAAMEERDEVTSGAGENGSLAAEEARTSIEAGADTDIAMNTDDLNTFDLMDNVVDALAE